MKQFTLDKLFVSWIPRATTTRKTGKNNIHKKTLKSVLAYQLGMPVPNKDVFESTNAANNYKKNHPGIFAYEIKDEICVYNNDVVRPDNMKGSLVFVDLDDVELANIFWEHKERLKGLLPSMVAMWFSVRGKLHIAFCCEWKKKSGYRLAWDAVTSATREAVRTVFGTTAVRDFNVNNDKSLNTPLHLLNVGHTKGVRIWESFVQQDTSSLDIEKYLFLDTPKQDVPVYSLFSDEDVLKRWKKSQGAKSFVKWYEETHLCSYVTENKKIVYDKTVNITDNEYTGTYSYWENDGDYYSITLKGNYKLNDGRKRMIARACVFFSSVLGYSFEDTLYCVCKYYVDNMNNWAESYDVEKNTLLNKVEYNWNNRKRADTSFLKVTKPLFVDPHINTNKDWYWYDKSCNMYSGRDIQHLESIIKKKLRQEYLKNVYDTSDTLETLTKKMVSKYPKITESVVYEVANECSIDFKKPKKKYDYGDKYKGMYKYVWAWRMNGEEPERKRIAPKKIDNVVWFKSKKALLAHNEEEYAEHLDEYIEEWEKTKDEEIVL